MEKNKVSFKKIIFKVLKYICIALLSVIVLFTSGIMLFSCIGSCNGPVSANADQVTKLYDFTGSNVFLHSSHFRPSDFTIQYPDNIAYHGVIVEENHVETLNLQFSIVISFIVIKVIGYMMRLLLFVQVQSLGS